MKRYKEIAFIEYDNEDGIEVQATSPSVLTMLIDEVKKHSPGCKLDYEGYLLSGEMISCRIYNIEDNKRGSLAYALSIMLVKILLDQGWEPYIKDRWFRLPEED